MKEKEGKSEFYSDLKDLARDTTNLLFQLLRDRVLRFNIERALKINTFLLNYFLIQNYFLAFDLQDDFVKRKKLTEEEEVDASFFRDYIIFNINVEFFSCIFFDFLNYFI